MRALALTISIHCSLPIPPENIRNPVFAMFPGGIGRDHRHEMS